MTEPEERAPATPPATPSRRGWMRWALAASVALNLLLAGLGVGVIIRAHMGEDARALTHGEGSRAERRALREQARAVMNARAPAFDVARARVGGAWRAVRAAAAAEPLETARLETALADLRAAQEMLTRERHAALVALVERLPADERARAVREIGRAVLRAGRVRGEGG